MKISIIIPTRGRSESLKRCTDSIEKHTNLDYELIIVDHEGGMNEKKNYGARMATGDYLVFLHDDVEATEGWLDTLADVGAFHYGELGGKFYIWGGKGDSAYCKDKDDPTDYTDFLILSREAYAKIGPFDEFYKEAGWQDTDFGRQVKQAGYTFTNLPGQIIHHALRNHPLSETNKEYYQKKWA